MLKRVATLAAVAAALALALGGELAGGEVPADPHSGQVTRQSRETQDAAPADTARGGRGDESQDSGAEAEEEETPSADADEPDAAEAEEVGGVAPSGLAVLRAYICKGIDESEPTEAGKSFIPAADGVLRLCCFSEVGGSARPDTVFHVWYWGDREMARVSLRVEGARWRTWSAKRIIDEWRGDWRVDIVDRDGFVLTRLRFSVE
jgi:hypothetical protein